MSIQRELATEQRFGFAEQQQATAGENAWVILRKFTIEFARVQKASGVGSC